MKNLIITFSIIGGVCLSAKAQNDVDALRYSFIKSGYTAKSLSLGGAVGSLGADIASGGINPASLAQYKSGEASLTIGLNNILNSSVYLENTKEENLFKANIPSFGLVFTHRKLEKGVPAKEGWVNINFGMSMGRVADFNRILSYGGVNNKNSLLDYFAERSNGITPGSLQATNDELDYGLKSDETMAWESYLIDHAGNNQYVASIDQLNKNITQKGVITSSGGMNEFNFNLAANYSNQLYLGGGLKVTAVNFNETNKFTEINDPKSALGWNNYSYEHKLSTSGTGLSGILGLVYRANDNFRVGLSYNTPTNFKLDDEYSSKLSASFDTGAFYDFKSVRGYYTYEIQTPSKTTLSATYLFGKKGFLSADFDAINYGTMRLRPSIDAFEVANDVIRSKYNNAYNLRFGGEWVQDVFRFRGGFASYGSPFKDKSSKMTNQTISGGIGIKDKNWGLDIGVVRSLTKDVYQPYVLNKSAVPVSENNWRNTQVVVSLTGTF